MRLKYKAYKWNTVGRTIIHICQMQYNNEDNTKKVSMDCELHFRFLKWSLERRQGWVEVIIFDERCTMDKVAKDRVV